MVPPARTRQTTTQFAVEDAHTLISHKGETWGDSTPLSHRNLSSFR